MGNFLTVIIPAGKIFAGIISKAKIPADEKHRKLTVNRGNIGDIMLTGIMMIAMVSVMVCFIDCVSLVQTKSSVSQIARKYLLIAETEGCITDSGRTELMAELETAGLSEIDLGGTTFSCAGFGNTVTVSIKGKISGTYEISEIRRSTAKY